MLDHAIVGFNTFHPRLPSFVSETEEVFFFLVQKAEAKIGREKLNRIIEAPDQAGDTVFKLAILFSTKLAGWILDSDIDVDFVDSTWRTARFHPPTLVRKMMLMGINPFIVSYSGFSEFQLRPENFKNIDKKLLKPFLLGRISSAKTAAFYSFVDSTCGPKCGKKCGDKMKKFKLYTGRKKIENEKLGGEGIVGFGEWHGEEAAFKKVKLGKIQDTDLVADVVANAEKTRAEFEVARKLSNENIVKVLHLFRYQETEIKRNNRSTYNWTVTVMEKHSKNIGELAEVERPEIKTLLKDCLGRGFIFFIVQGTFQTSSVSRRFFQILSFYLESRSLTPRFPMRQIGAFRLVRRDYARLRDRRMSWIVSKRQASVFYNKLKLFLNCERTCGLKDVSASIYDRKTDARPFDTIHDILRFLSLAQSLRKSRNALIWHIGNRGVN